MCQSNNEYHSSKRAVVTKDPSEAPWNFRPRPNCSVFFSIRFFLKTLSVHIARFSNEYAMKTIDVHIDPAKRCFMPFFQTMPLLAAVEKAPIASLNAIVTNSFSTKECEEFSNVSVSGVHIENGSFSKRTVFKSLRFH